MNQSISKLIAAAAAVSTTLVLFSAVASIADNDKAALFAAKAKPTQVAQASR